MSSRLGGNILLSWCMKTAQGLLLSQLDVLLCNMILWLPAMLELVLLYGWTIRSKIVLLSNCRKIARKASLATSADQGLLLLLLMPMAALRLSVMLVYASMRVSLRGLRIYLRVLSKLKLLAGVRGKLPTYLMTLLLATSHALLYTSRIDLRRTSMVGNLDVIWCLLSTKN